MNDAVTDSDLETSRKENVYDAPIHRLLNLSTETDPVLVGSDFVPQVVACLAATAVVVHSGVNLVYSAVLLPELMAPGSHLTITEDQASWIASLVTISTPVGSLLSGPLMDKFGRKSVCKLTCIPLICSWIIIAFVNNIYGLYCGRLLAGFGSGLATASLVYISEVTHPRWRPTLLCLISVFVSLGILITCVLCLWLDYDQIALCFAVFSLANFLMMCPLPESPHWLLRHGTEKKATHALRWLYRRDLCYHHQVKVLLDSHQSASASKHKSIVDYFSEYKKSSTIKPILILILMFIFQQISGAYIIIFYAVDILQLIGGKYGSGISEYGAFVVLGVIRFVMSIVTALASRKCGRRPVSIISGLGMAVSTLVAAMCITASDNSGNLFQTAASETPTWGSTSPPGEGHADQWVPPVLGGSTSPPGEGHEDQWVPLVCVLVYVFFSSLGVLVIPWTLIGELPPISVRGSCGGFMMAFSYVIMFVVIKTFPYFLQVFKTKGMFYIFSVTSFLGAAFVFFFLPETRGKNFQEIESYFR